MSTPTKTPQSLPALADTDDSGVVGEYFRQAREDLPTPETLSVVAAQLPRGAPPSVPGDGGATATGAGSAGSTVAKAASTFVGLKKMLAVVGASAVLATGGWWVWRAWSPSGPPPVAQRTPAVGSSAIADVEPAADARPVDFGTSADGAAAPDVEPFDATEVGGANASPELDRRRRVRTSGRGAGARLRRSLDGRSDRSLPELPESIGQVEPRASEVELLERARAAFAPTPATALRLLREHQRRFPAGALTQEREVLLIDVHVRLGDRRAARERADRFRRRFPRSIHFKRIQAALDRLRPTPAAADRAAPR